MLESIIIDKYKFHQKVEAQYIYNTRYDFDQCLSIQDDFITDTIIRELEDNINEVFENESYGNISNLISDAMEDYVVYYLKPEPESDEEDDNYSD